MTGRGGRAGSIPRPVILAAAILLAGVPAAQDEDRPGEPRPPAEEGPLSNDAFLPTSSHGEELLRAGDASLAEARGALSAGRRADAERLFAAAFEDWHESLDDPEGDSSVWIEPPAVVERRGTEGVSYAVARRLASLSPDEAAAWRARFEPVAQADLERAGRLTGALSELARRHPGTLAAARASLMLADVALERGRRARAAFLVDRAEEITAWIGAPASELAGALRRRRALASVAGPGDGPTAEEWRTASSLTPRGALVLPDVASRLAAHRLPAPDAGVRPGLAFLSDDRVVVQSTSRVHVVRIEADGTLQHETSFEPAELVPGFHPEIDVRQLGRRPPGWANLPVEHEGLLFLVQGRSDDQPNALLCVRPPTGRRGPALFPGADAYVPQLSWAIVGNRRVDALGAAVVIDALAGLDDLELQPGPVVAGDLVLVQARELATDTRAWLLAFDCATGELAWSRFLGQGSDLYPSMGRVGGGRAMRLAAQPLLALGARVFAGTHLGAGVLLDVVDGRPVWSLKNRRRDATDPGWDGRRPVPCTSPADCFFWGPIDSDRLYTLRAAPLPGADEPELLFAARPRPLGEAEILVGGEPDAVVVQGRAGAEETVSERRLPGTDPIDALYLGPDERFQGRGLVTPERVYAASDRGLFLFDRSRELYLLDYAPLEATRALSVGGDVYARADLVLVVSRDGLWAFEAR